MSASPQPPPAGAPLPGKPYQRQNSVTISMDDVEDASGVHKPATRRIAPAIISHPKHTGLTAGPDVALVRKSGVAPTPAATPAPVPSQASAQAPVPAAAHPAAPTVGSANEWHDAILYLCENIARTLGRTATAIEQSKVGGASTGGIDVEGQRLVSELREAFTCGSVDLVSKALDCLRHEIARVNRLRDKMELLNSTAGSAYSALNTTERELADLRTRHERLLGAVAHRAEAADPDQKALLTDRHADPEARIAAAEAVVAASAQVAPAPAPAGTSAQDAARLALLDEEVRELRRVRDQVEARLVAQQADADARVEAVQQRLAAAETAGQAQATAAQQAEDARQELAGRCSGLERELASAQAECRRLAGFEAERTSLASELAEVRGRLDQAEAERSRLAAEAEAGRAQVQAAGAEIEADAARRLQSAEALRIETLARAERAESALAGKERDIAALRVQLQGLQALVEAGKAQEGEAEALRARLRQVQDQVEALQAARAQDAERDERLARAEAERDGARDRIRQQAAELATLHQKCAALEEQIVSLVAEKSDLEKRAEELLIERAVLSGRAEAAEGLQARVDLAEGAAAAARSRAEEAEAQVERNLNRLLTAAGLGQEQTVVDDAAPAV